MSQTDRAQGFEERMPLLLRALYEQYGYAQYRMGKFEPYDLYLENKNFLKGEGIITFTGFDGRLMALKPDVTMSIVKNVAPDAPPQKYYYLESVFRMAPGSREYREIRQMGLENIGPADDYTQAETVMLAMRSLQSIGRPYRLSLSDMGFVAAVLDDCALEDPARAQALAALEGKNPHAMAALCGGIGEKQAALLHAMTTVSGPAGAALAQIAAVTPENLCGALEPLKRLCALVQAMGCGENLRVDFSVMGDMDYYNGLIFEGYVEKIPRPVLCGGRYDNLLRRFGKPQEALGFALYLSEMSRAMAQARSFDADALLIYGDAPAQAVAQAVAALTAQGQSVRAQRTGGDALRVRQVYRMDQDGKMEVQFSCLT